MHRVDQDKAVSNPAFSHDRSTSRDANDVVALVGVDVQFFHVGGGGSGQGKGPHVKRLLLGAVKERLGAINPLISRSADTSSHAHRHARPPRGGKLYFPLASAETYRISGQATYSDNMPVMLRDVYVECPPGEVDRYQHRGASAITDANGMFLDRH